MRLTRTANIRLLKIAGAIAIVGIIIIYAVWRSFNYTLGPGIEINEPADGSSVFSPTISIKGKATRINDLSLNGKMISVDQEGNFSETIVVFPGLNTISLSASDQFGRKIKREIRLAGMANISTTNNPDQSTSTQPL